MLAIPSRCWLCYLPLAIPHWGICSCCSARLPELPPACPRCALPALSDAPCGRCRYAPPSWDRLICISDYQSPLRTLIARLKFSRTPALAQALSRLLLLRILDARHRQQVILPDRILSVPLHQKRHCQRGYNQSALLALPLARWLGCTYQPDALIRQRNTRIQHRLPALLRKQNLRGAFRVDIPVKGLHIALVDDVVTTGATVDEITCLLKKQGAVTVQIWCLCRTL